MSRRHELNKTVREQFPGGDFVLRALASCDRMVLDRKTDSHAQELLQLLRQAANEMREAAKPARAPAGMDLDAAVDRVSEALSWVRRHRHSITTSPQRQAADDAVSNLAAAIDCLTQLT